MSYGNGLKNVFDILESRRYTVVNSMLNAFRTGRVDDRLSTKDMNGLKSRKDRGEGSVQFKMPEQRSSRIADG